MLTIWGRSTGSFCDGMSRRDFLKVGALGVGGLTLADLLRLKAQGAVHASSPNKAIIMVYLNGGPSHIDMYDLKPDAPVEYRGEFKPIQTNVPGMDICELMPLQAKIADKLAIIRNMKFQQQGHTPPELFTGFLRGNRPSIGSVVSKLRSDAGIRAGAAAVCLPGRRQSRRPARVSSARRTRRTSPARRPTNLGLAPRHDARPPGRSPRAAAFLRRAAPRPRRRPRQHGRHGCLHRAGAGDDRRPTRPATPSTSARSRSACASKYGKGAEFLQARRLVEAGVPVVTLTPRNRKPGPKCNGEWDHHDHIFRCLRAVVPQLDQSIYALVTDLHERGLDKDVAVVVWGEMGRTPRVGTQRGTTAGRDHWPQSGFALMAGGGLHDGPGHRRHRPARRATRRASRTRRKTCWRRSTTSSASTRRPRCPITRAGRSICSTIARRWRNWFDPRFQDASG